MMIPLTLDWTTLVVGVLATVIVAVIYDQSQKGTRR